MADTVRTTFQYTTSQLVTLRQTSTGHVTFPLTRVAGEPIPAHAKITYVGVMATKAYEYSSWREFKIYKNGTTTPMSDALRTAGGATDGGGLVDTAPSWDLYTTTSLYTDLTSIMFKHSESSNTDNTAILGFAEGCAIYVFIDYTAAPILNREYPKDVVATSAAPVTLEVVIETHGAPQDYTYQWHKNGTAIDGATSKTLSVTPASTEATYSCLVRCSGGNVLSREASVKMSSGASITIGKQPCAVMPYLHIDGKWVAAVPYVYSNGSFKPSSMGATSGGGNYDDDDFVSTAFGKLVVFQPVSNAPLKPLTSIRFTQGGSGVPSATNVRPITGVSEVRIVHSGPNLLALPNANAANYDGVEWSCVNGIVTANGTAVDMSMSSNVVGVPTLPFGTYKTFGYTDKVSVVALVLDNGVLTYYINGAPFEINENKVLYAAYCQVAAGLTVNEIVYPMIVPSNLAITTPEPFIGAEYTIKLPTTTYVGSLDLDTGDFASFYELIESYAGESLGSTSWWSDRASQDANTTPPLGAQVLVPMAEGIAAKLSVPSFRALPGINIVQIHAGDGEGAVEYIDSGNAVELDQTTASLSVSSTGAATVNGATLVVDAGGDATISRFKVNTKGVSNIQ